MTGAIELLRNKYAPTFFLIKKDKGREMQKADLALGYATPLI